ncbi:AlpA family phage regulatory protein [Nitratireductor mangrovi]|uniref:AlpA family phage regulatory protein n=1 Tax=Nitratireductor mangrovi TaxID=2599600 RepID=A0A5B8L3R6_9HYPH|nr:AlpA family phage regulatory protein [Nitratireductor mangrovi]
MAQRSASQTDLFENAAAGEPPSVAPCLSGPLRDATGAGATQSSLPADATGHPRRHVESFLSDRDVAKRYRVSRPTIWRWCQNNPAFPRPRQMSPGTTRWLLSELERFEGELPAAASVGSTETPGTRSEAGPKRP